MIHPIVTRYLNGVRPRQIAREQHISHTYILGFLLSYNAPMKGRSVTDDLPPTIEEIQQRAAEIRSRWNGRTERLRRSWNTKRFEFPVISFPKCL